MASIGERWENALRRVVQEHVRPIALGHHAYLVGSSTVPSRGYFTRLYPDGRLTCTCPAGYWRKPCKHAAAVWWIEQDAREGVLGCVDR